MYFSEKDQDSMANDVINKLIQANTDNDKVLVYDGLINKRNGEMASVTIWALPFMGPSKEELLAELDDKIPKRILCESKELTKNECQDIEQEVVELLGIY